ncbi:hypothetical protein N2152v2_001633 [Parachlorella kessleri]
MLDWDSTEGHSKDSSNWGGLAGSIGSAVSTNSCGATADRLTGLEQGVHQLQQLKGDIEQGLAGQLGCNSPEPPSRIGVALRVSCMEQVEQGRQGKGEAALQAREPTLAFMGGSQLEADRQYWEAEHEATIKLAAEHDYVNVPLDPIDSKQVQRGTQQPDQQAAADQQQQQHHQQLQLTSLMDVTQGPAEGHQASGAGGSETVPQQARSFLQQAYTLISRLKNNSRQASSPDRQGWDIWEQQRQHVTSWVTSMQYQPAAAGPVMPRAQLQQQQPEQQPEQLQQAANICAERAVRDETERKELKEQSQALRAAAKQRLKQQSKQARGQAADSHGLDHGILLTGQPRAASPQQGAKCVGTPARLLRRLGGRGKKGQAAQLLKLAADEKMLSEHEGLVRQSLARLDGQLAARGLPSSDLDSALTVAPRANSLMQLRLNKSIARLDGQLAGVLPAKHRPTPPVGKPLGSAAATPCKNRRVKPAAELDKTANAGASGYKQPIPPRQHEAVESTLQQRQAVRLQQAAPMGNHPGQSAVHHETTGVVPCPAWQQAHKLAGEMWLPTLADSQRHKHGPTGLQVWRQAMGCSSPG